MEERLRTGTSPITGRQPTTQEYINYYAGLGDPHEQFVNVLEDRRQMDRRAAEHGLPRDFNMRNAEHALLTRSNDFKGQIPVNYWVAGDNIGRYADAAGRIPWLTSVINALAVPAYSGLKWASQNVPGADRYVTQPLFGDSLKHSTPPSFEEMKWGLAPYWGGMPAHNQPPQPPPQPPPMSLPALRMAIKAMAGTLQ